MTVPYNATILDHFRRPRHYGALPSPDVVYEDVNPLCGDRIRMELQIGAEQIIVAARFRGDSCIISRAAASILTEFVQGRPLREVEALSQDDFLASLNSAIRPARMTCALLPLDVLQGGIRTYFAS